MKFLFSALLFSLLFLQSAYAAEVSVFSSPENSLSALYYFADTENSFNISVYEFTSPEILNFVSPKADKVLVEKSPVGGMKEIEEKILCNLEEKGAEVRLFNGPEKFLHAKYLVGDKVLVSSENLGLGFSKNRGWGAIIEDKEIQKEFKKVFNKDFEKSEEFNCKLDDYFLDNTKTNFPETQIEKYKVDIQAIFAPDTATEGIISLLDSANKSIYIEQFYIYKNWGTKNKPKPNLFLEKVLEKARQGIEVKILLDSTNYNIEESDPNSNLNTANFLNQIAQKEKLDLEVKLANLQVLGVDKIHNKGVIVDDKRILISSINWNENSPKRNREAGVIIEGGVAGYFSSLFKKDFSDSPIQTTQQELTGKIVSRGTELVIIIAATIILYGAFSYFRNRKNISRKQTN